MKYLYKNISGNELWERSFMGRLIDDHIWDKEEFWHLHAELTRYSIENKNENYLPRDVISEVARIVILIMKAYASHNDHNDSFVIKGVNNEELYEFMERVELLSTALFSGDINSENDFELKNPYLLNA